HNRFNYPEFQKVRWLLFSLGVVATLGVFIFYPLVMQLPFISPEWVDSIPTSRYMLPYLFPALAICPLTVIELVFGSPKYFLQIQLEQLLVVLIAFVAFPYFYPDYGMAVLLYACLSFVRYSFIYLRVTKRAHSMKSGELEPSQ
ncbi:MAG: capsular biosynthesis protein, partial [Vibrio sp.]